MARFHVQIVGSFETTLPRTHIDLLHVVDAAAFEIHIAADCLVDPFLGSRCYFDKREWAELEACLVDVFQVLRHCINIRQITLLDEKLVLYLIPDTKCLQISYKIGINLEKLAVESAAAKYLSKLWVNTGCCTCLLYTSRCV